MVRLVIVESPAKCKKIESFLGTGYKCTASFGHIYQLAEVLNKDNFKPKFKLLPSKAKYIKSLKTQIAKASEVILATDDDREGEAIAWHICRLAKLPINTTKRIIFHEITRPALQTAMRNPTIIDLNKVHSQLGRQVLDRLVGFSISPVLWKQFYHGGKNKSGLSAGRCQTPALRVIYENQLDIDESPGTKVFETTGYFTSKNLPFKLNHNFDEEKVTEEFLEESVNFDHVLMKPAGPTISVRKAPLPFSTSTLQQRASNILRYTPKRTMQLAQKLYENGYITYMRTDNKKYSKEFVRGAVKFIKTTWTVDGKYIRNNLPVITIGESKSKDKNAQEAHEAIRPTKLSTREISLGPMEKRLYDLIWYNTVESCMSNAQMNILTAIVTAPQSYLYKYVTEQVHFPGWMIVQGYNKVNELYEFVKSQDKKAIDYNKIYSKQNLKNLKTHFTEARLVSVLEKKGIGRPSTFSGLVSKIQERGYVQKGNIKGKTITCTDYELVGEELEEIQLPRTFGNERNKLIIQPLGIMVAEFLIKYFDELFVYEYTGEMEKRLDNILKGNSVWQDLCRDCDLTIKRLLKDVTTNRVQVQIDEHHTYMIGKYGPVIKCEKDGETVFKGVKKDLDIDMLRKGDYTLTDIVMAKPVFCGRSLGSFKNKEVLLKKGKYGLYMVCGEKTYSLKGLRKSETSIRLEDVIDILLGTKSSNPNILRILSEEMSVRKGKFGIYVYYKAARMKKPRFFGLHKVFGENTTRRWESYSSSELIDLVRQNCL